MVETPDVSVAALRRLAQGLLFDSHGAEDVVQEAWLAALGLQHAPPRPGAWLTEAVKRLARNRRREEARRRAREQSAARPEELPGADERAAQLEILHRLLDALGRLEEPYRSAVMLRYLDDVPPRELARRLGVPVNTARTHVRRGLERLRKDLDGEGRQELLAALVPFTGRPLGATVAPWHGARASKFLIGAAIAVLVGVSWFALRGATGRGAGASGLASTATSALPASANSTEPTGLERGQGNAREPAGSSSAAMSASWVVRGHVFRGPTESFPLAPLVGRMHTGAEQGGALLFEERFQATAEGDFAWATAPPPCLVTVSVEPELDGYASNGEKGVFAPGDSAPERWTITAYPFDCTIHGRIWGPGGSPLEGAQVLYPQRWEETLSDRGGRYSLSLSTQIDAECDLVELVANAPGFAPSTFSVDIARRGEIQAPDISLGPELRLRGKVVDTGGVPIEGAHVSAFSGATAEAMTNAEGKFELGGLDPRADRIMVTAQKDEARATAELTTASLPTGVELRLGAGQDVTGTVLGANGSPVWGARIQTNHGGEAYSDERGRFVLSSTPVKRLRLWVTKSGFAQTKVTPSFAKGSTTFDVRIELEPGHHLGGLVVDAQGSPIPWASIRWLSPSLVLVERGEMELETHAGSDGRFSIEGLPPGTISLQVCASGRGMLEQVLTELDRDDLVLRMGPSSWIAGRVIDAGTGLPIPSFVVHVGRPMGVDMGEARERGVFLLPIALTRSMSSADGAWSLGVDLVPGSSVPITIESPDHASAEFEAVQTTVRPEPEAWIVRLTSSGSR